MKLFNAFVFLALSTLSSCTIIIPAIKEIPGFNSGYERLNEDLQSKIEFSSMDNPLPIDPNKLNATDAQTMKIILQDHDSALIYMWSTHCSSEYCLNPLYLKQHCDSVDLEFILIAEYFDKDDLQTLPTDYIMYGINYNVYNTNRCNKYNKRFQKELFGKKLTGRYFIYTKDESRAFDITTIL